jgi:Xaa-Pro aminopeptidase
VEDWKRVYAKISGDVEEVDIAPGLSTACFSVKDTDELVRLRDA